MTRKQKKMLVRIAVSAVLLIAAVLVPYQGLWRFALFLPAYFVIGWDVLWRSTRWASCSKATPWASPASPSPA